MMLISAEVGARKGRGKGTRGPARALMTIFAVERPTESRGQASNTATSGASSKADTGAEVARAPEKAEASQMLK